MGLFTDYSETIGRSPLVQLSRAVPEGATIFAKVEGRNPTFSVKCRLGAALVWDAEQRGVLHHGVEIIEPTSGNTGIALAFVAAARGYGLTLVMPESATPECRQVLKAFGATVVLTDGDSGMVGAVKRATEIRNSDPERYFMPQQFENAANPAIHETTTGPEIWDDLRGWVDVLVAGVGTGGTITGISRYIKHRKRKALTTVAVEPAECPTITLHLAGQEPRPSPHLIQGIGAGFIPKTLDLSLLDRVEQVSSAEALTYTRTLAREEGILCGVSSGAALAVAVRLASRSDFANKSIVVILPDAGERYLSGPLFDRSGTADAKAGDVL
jgi:cysteine synthase A